MMMVLMVIIKMHHCHDHEDGDNDGDNDAVWQCTLSSDDMAAGVLPVRAPRRRGASAVRHVAFALRCRCLRSQDTASAACASAAFVAKTLPLPRVLPLPS